MTFKRTYPEVRELIRTLALQTPLARGIVRKSGFKLAPLTIAIPTVGGLPILSLPAITYGPAELGAGLYFHPANLPHYIAKWDLSHVSEARISAVVTDVTPSGVITPNVTLKAIYSPTYSTTLGSPWTDLTSGANFSESGFYLSDWAAIPPAAKAEEVYIAMVLQTHVAVGGLAVGQTEVRTR